MRSQPAGSRRRSTGVPRDGHSLGSAEATPLGADLRMPSSRWRMGCTSARSTRSNISGVTGSAARIIGPVTTRPPPSLRGGFGNHPQVHSAARMLIAALGQLGRRGEAHSLLADLLSGSVKRISEKIWLFFRARCAPKITNTWWMATKRLECLADGKPIRARSW